MTTRILMVHYTPPGVVGGAEYIIQQHIDLLTARGFHVEVAAGRPGVSTVPIHVIPEIDAARPENVRLEAELAGGVVSADFEQCREAVARQLFPLAAEADFLIVHNAFTLHFSLPLTAVLWELSRMRATGATIAWCHDLAWTNPLYIPAMHEGYPWILLRQPAPNVQYVTVSEERKRELVALWSERGDHVAVVPNGIDPTRFLRLSPLVSDLVKQHELFDRDLVLVLPVRITRRKNIEIGIHVVRALKDRGIDACFLVSGPVAPHHPGRSRTYLEELKALRAQVGLDREVIFLADELGKNLDEQTVAQLYSVADVLFFPSSQEGFGLPILEAGLARVPIVLSNIPIFGEVGAMDVVAFGLEDSADTIAASIMRTLDAPTSRLYRRVLREYRWDAIVERKIIPLLSRSAIQGDPRAAFGRVGEDPLP